MPTRYIDRVGVELEGAWEDCPEELGHDGSVNVDCSGSDQYLEQGELASPPLGFLQAQKWIRDSYPDKANETCGMHVHFSLKHNSDYARLMDKKFHEFFVAWMTKFGERYPIKNRHYWERLKGNNRFCRKEHKPYRQMFRREKGDHRYTQLNYCHSMHGTIECRLFPVFKEREIAVSAFKSLITCVETYLYTTPDPSKNTSWEVYIGDKGEIVKECAS